MPSGSPPATSMTTSPGCSDVRLGHRGGGRAPRHQGGGAAERRPAPGTARPADHQHQRPVGHPPGRSPPRGVAPALFRHPLLQPAALPAPGRTGAAPGQRPGAAGRHGRLPAPPARQGGGDLQGHPELHRQPHRPVQPAQRHAPHAGPRFERRRGRCRLRPGHRPPQERGVPHRRPGRPRYPGLRRPALL